MSNKSVGNDPISEHIAANTANTDLDEQDLAGQAASDQDLSDDSGETEDAAPVEPVEMDIDDFTEERPAVDDDAELRAILEAVVYVTDEPLTAQQISAALEQPIDRVTRLLNELVEEYQQPSRGLSIREVAGGYRMATKAEHHESVRAFVKKLTPPLKLSLAALETLSVIAYKQPVTAPEIMEIRGVQGTGVLKTLLERKLINEAGRKNVVGKPILYKTTKEFLIQFGLKNVKELPTLKEFEELGRMELVEESTDTAADEAATGDASLQQCGPSSHAGHDSEDRVLENPDSETPVSEDSAAAVSAAGKSDMENAASDEPVTTSTDDGAGMDEAEQKDADGDSANA